LPSSNVEYGHKWDRRCDPRARVSRLLGYVPSDRCSNRRGGKQMCQQHQKRHVAAARLYADAFAAEPKLAADLNAQHRYHAACSAALATAGQGEDARLLPDKVVAMFRRWALGWLRDDLTAYRKIAQQSNPAVKRAIQQRLAHWQRDLDLAGLRDKDAVDKLPEAERDACQKLWADVAALLKRTQEK
jgi:eukaryotic-like serine/threonine-protein kinase